MMPTPFESRTLARLMADLPVEAAELAAMSAEWRPLANLLATSPFPDRSRILDASLAIRPDRDAIIRALANADPTGPPPAAGSAPPSSDWPSLRLEELPPVEPFPVDVLPGPAARLATEGADAIGCPRDFLGVPILAVAAGTIGRSVSLRLKPNYFVNAVVFASAVGPPSDGKTPALKAAAGAIREIRN